ncbi:pyruvate dehydrogenase (acetyl-transferring), homodimeric type [Streptomyces sp. NBC_01619]|uniref:Pyruvate dehydrogenase (Acetyl-transferring), homodimeric type n=1 Tax=Streptomyces pratisoli TaxID=3139917 RepID=A0ACC6QE83_9ACTN|nr:pyruvate dehydrogenase (acetyl-transferring), homodimeric type [Streptomyces sp. NBC_01619]MCX4509504.1 pyruvate dehydrogenase (acetyl-transferring), homodimeric type [Streptomyces sp. NBC_01619]
MTDPVGKLPSELDQLPDRDTEETAEWAASLDAVTKAAGPHRAAYLMRRTLQHAEGVSGLDLPKLLETDYVNTIPTAAEPAVDGDEAMEQRITAWNRWNAAAMVTRGAKHGVGGHIATFASAAWLYETGFNHFFRGKEQDGSGDQLYIQGHASPGIYARAFLDGRLTEAHLDNFRQESGGNGLPSYPHPRRLPWLWEFPTVSMGLGPLSAIYQARFNRYLTNRGIKDVSASHVWAFLGDGEMDEPESTAALALAAREGLDNLTFVINCNLQRLDGPVRANFKIVQELEAQFRGAGWNVVKSLWGNAWDELFQLDTTGALVRRLREVPDAQVQTYQTRDAAYIREDFFGKDPALVEMAKLLSDDKILECFHLSRGGHEPRKVYAAYKAAVEHKGAPTVILAQTVKGYTLGEGFASKNANHQMKKLTVDEFRTMRDLLGLPISDAAFADGQVPYGHPGADSPEVRYLQERRAALGGPAPARRVHPLAPLPAPAEKAFAAFDKGSGKQALATTMAFVRLVKDLIRDKDTGKRWVPIVPDEARTFGMESLFPSLGIYSPKGQTYEPVDRDQLMYYREAKDGQILNEGITEAGSMADFIAASTAYSTHGETMIPFYIFYSMFGWQRTADQMWQLGDQLGKGFLVGATAGRTTLTGEGLQHADGHSPMIAATNPAALTYDPAFAYEIAAIVKDGLRRMYGEARPDEDSEVFYYLTVYNEPMVQPAKPEGVDEGIVRGLYRFNEGEGAADNPRIQLLASGTAIHWALQAQQLLASDWGVTADVWSATSWTELRRDALEADAALLRGESRVPYVRQALEGAQGPVLAVSDYMRQVPDQIAQWVEQDWSSLGADGFGLSDTREAARRHFGVDAQSVVVAALAQLARRGEVPASAVKDARERYGF